MKKPSWKMYFLKLADVARTRSHDPHTQHGCVIVDSQNRVISMGYNGFPSGYPDSIVPVTRPEKYDFIVHAEANSVIFAKRNLEDCSIYITGYPCFTCLNLIIQSGIRHIICLDMKSKCLSPDYDKTLAQILLYSSAKLSVVKTEQFKKYWQEYEK